MHPFPNRQDRGLVETKFASRVSHFEIIPAIEEVGLLSRARQRDPEYIISIYLYIRIGRERERESSCV